MSVINIDRPQATSTPTTAPVIEVSGVRKTYGDREVLRGIDLAVRPGEFFGILGPNGAGKTTLVEIIEGLRASDGGEVRLLGESPHRRRSALLRRVGVQTQKGAFFTRLTAREHLVTMASLYRVPADQADRTLETVGLTGQADVRVDRLSGGQQQRLAIAGALVHDPDVIFLDEPTAALDPQARRDLWTVLRDLREQGRTIIYTTHHLDEAEALCDRVAILVEGRIRALDTPYRLKSASAGPAQVRLPVDRLDPDRARSIPGVTAVRQTGGALILETAQPSDVLLAVSGLVGLEGVETHTPNLEDVYLELTSQQPHTEEAIR